MQDRDRPSRQRAVAGRVLWIAALASVGAFGLVRFAALVETDSQVQSLQPPVVHEMASAVSSAPTSDGVPDGMKAPDPLWASLSASQRQALSPLEPIWPTMDESARHRWLAFARRFHLQSHAVQAKMHARMVEWSKLSPQQRTEARLQYLKTAKVDARWKRERWEAYKKKEADQGDAVTTSPMRVIPPFSVNAGTGATTILLPQLAGMTMETLPAEEAAQSGVHSR